MTASAKIVARDCANMITKYYCACKAADHMSDERFEEHMATHTTASKPPKKPKAEEAATRTADAKSKALATAVKPLVRGGRKKFRLKSEAEVAVTTTADTNSKALVVAMMLLGLSICTREDVDTRYTSTASARVTARVSKPPKKSKADKVGSTPDAKSKALVTVTIQEDQKRPPKTQLKKSFRELMVEFVATMAGINNIVKKTNLKRSVLNLMTAFCNQGDNLERHLTTVLHKQDYSKKQDLQATRISDLVKNHQPWEECVGSDNRVS